MKTGTTTLAIKGKDYVVLAADKRATAGSMIINKKVQKVFKILDNLGLTVAGNYSDIQLLMKYIKAELKLKEIRTSKRVNVKEAVNLLATLVYTNLRQMFPGITQFLVAGFDRHGVHLYDVFPDGSLNEEDEYVCSGSGMVFALGVLDALYNKNIPLDEAKKLAIKAINAALQRDTASGEGIDMMVVTKDSVEKVHTEQLTVRLNENIK